MIKLAAIIGTAALILVSALSPTFGQTKLPNVCAAKIEELTRDGGTVSRVTDATRNIWDDMRGGGKVLVYRHEHGFAGPSAYGKLAVLEKHEQIAKSGRMWFVVANRSILREVREGKLPLGFEDGEPVPSVSVWFSMFVFPGEDGTCWGFVEDKGLFEDDLSREMWTRVVSSHLLLYASKEE